MSRRKPPNNFKTYWLLCVLRVLLVFIPQTGYIHPDEYFQTIEPLAGRMFELDANLPWEFNVTSPIRSIGVPYFTIGFSYKLLQIVNHFSRLLYDISLMCPYALLIAPRLFMCLSSFLIDYSLYKLCMTNNEKFKSRLLILSSSFVTLVYGSRTFTNTIEMVLFALLLYFIGESMIFSNIVVRQREYLNSRYNKSSTPAERAKFHKLRLFLASHSFRNCLQISGITVLGFFNRPTFLCFAVLPIFLWLYRGIGYKSVTTMLFHSRILVLILASVPVVLFLILIDSFFYGYISWGEIGMLDVSINSFVFPPLNFIRYNINSENLANHGLHPRYVHMLVNIPMLFNVMGVIAIAGVADIITKLFKKKYHMLPTVRSLKGLMTVSFVGPLFFLSMFPHQEPRFLVPVIMPLVYLYASKIYTEPDYGLVRADIKKDTEGDLQAKDKNYLLKLWYFFNAICLLYFGFLHQGGVYSAASHLSKEIQAKPFYNYHIVTSHIYSIPHVLFLQPDPKKIFYKDKVKYSVMKHVFTYEEGSKDLDALLVQITTILNEASGKKRRYKLYLLMTATLENGLNFTKAGFNQLNFRNLKSFYPHISGEAMPDFSELFHMVGVADFKHFSLDALMDCLLKLVSSFQLNLYEVSLVEQLVV